MTVYAENRKAYHDYEILEKYEAGLVLGGFEVKAIKNGRASLAGARVIIRGNEAFTIGMGISPYQASNAPESFDGQRAVKLLLNRKEISYLASRANQKGLTIMPLKLYNSDSKVKLEIAVAKGKKLFDKRETIKKREDKRKMERMMKENL